MAYFSHLMEEEKRISLVSNWTIESGSLHSAVRIGGNDFNSDSFSQTLSFEPSVVLVKDDADMGSCEINFCMNQASFTLNRIQILSSARTCELYARKWGNHESDYVCTVKGIHFSENSNIQLALDSKLESTPISDSSNCSNQNLNLSPNLESNFNKTHSAMDKNLPNLYTTDVDFPISTPCVSISIKLLSLANRGRGEIVSVFMNMVEHRIQNSRINNTELIEAHMDSHSKSNNIDSNSLQLNDFQNSSFLNSNLRDFHETFNNNNNNNNSNNNSLLLGLLSSLPLQASFNGEKGKHPSFEKFANIQNLSSQFSTMLLPSSSPPSLSPSLSPLSNVNELKVNSNSAEESFQKSNSILAEAELAPSPPTVTSTSSSFSAMDSLNMSEVCSRLNRVEECCSRMEKFISESLSSFDKRITFIENCFLKFSDSLKFRSSDQNSS